MGTFMGHLLPGAFLSSFALWWTVAIFRRYFASMMPGGAAFRSSATFPCICCCGRFRNWECEGFLKVLVSIIGITGELITAFKDGEFTYMGNGHHATMFFFFAINGVVDILKHYRLPMPPGIEYVSVMSAFVVEGVLFAFHMHGRSILDISIHQILLYVILVNVIAIGLEIQFRQHPLVALVRTGSIMLHGSWFIHVGFILYNPIPGVQPWDEDNHENIMLCTMFFAWHWVLVFCVMFTVGVLVGCRYRSRGEFDYSKYSSINNHNNIHTDSMHVNLLSRDRNGQTIVNLNDDGLSESETEFEANITSNNIK